MTATNGSPMTAPAHLDPGSAAFISRLSQTISNELAPVLRGKRPQIQLALCCLLAGGHLLIEDVPGTGKTSLARGLAAAISGSTRRIQFTPDLLPTDITGVSVWEQQSGSFQFHEGPVFANVVVADEINRASPKTQSALLEVMEEGRVTVDGVGHVVPQPFLVVATQNPIDLEGTYRLPEAQLDRFLMRIEIGHPDPEVECEILLYRAAAPAPEVSPVVDLDQIRWVQQAIGHVHVAPEIADYLVRIAAATRTSADLRLGVSTRGSLGALRAAQAWAACVGRHYVVPDDVRAVLGPVLTHRLVLTAQAEVRGATAAQVLDDVLATVPLPASPAAAR